MDLAVGGFTHVFVDRTINRPLNLSYILQANWKELLFQIRKRFSIADVSIT